MKSTTGTETHTYDYDTLDRIAFADSVNTATGQSQLLRYSYTLKNQALGIGVVASSSTTGGAVDTYEIYSYNTNGTISQKRMFSGLTSVITYDALYRPSIKTINGTSLTTNYTYENGAGTNTTTTLIDTLIYKNGSTTQRSFSYNYDLLGNITNAVDSVIGTTTYTYDTQNQLTQEVIAGTTYNYTYDTYGNIRSISGGATKTFTYGSTTWLDLLTAYNGAGITYDGAGNPTSYYNGATMTWQRGRQLASYTKSGATTSYTYNADGYRIRKVSGGVTHDYVIESGRIVADMTSGSTLIFSYDENGLPHSFTYNGTVYYYVTNQQGDVVEIRNTSGSVVAQYKYNAWGELLSSSGTMASVNPLRYRGYYYDSETGFYYLGSRYYDPVICRFINADNYITSGQGINEYNMFAYCGNNPINRYDSSGRFWKEIGNFFTNVGKKIGKFASSTFGASASLVYQEKYETPVVPDPWPITIKMGQKIKTETKAGNSSKPISVYALGRSDEYLLSSAGIKLNIGNFALTMSIGLDDIGISGSIVNGNITNSYKLTANCFR